MSSWPSRRCERWRAGKAASFGAGWWGARLWGASGAWKWGGTDLVEGTGLGTHIRSTRAQGLFRACRVFWEGYASASHKRLVCLRRRCSDWCFPFLAICLCPHCVCVCRYTGYIYLRVASILLVAVRLYRFIRYHFGECASSKVGEGGKGGNAGEGGQVSRVQPGQKVSHHDWDGLAKVKAWQGKGGGAGVAR